ncbi:collagen alpha-1(XI) chain-like [Hyalella azteca]|uniref:Collagen alpha-1(XI) chain-like n=1 Tax=Hyalella azteca TaxID=294128 RepID=A0A979FNB0_HYAAZ|nr:collagen alpha-1(XI) chain-like [Hyalella azteca]
MLRCRALRLRLILHGLIWTWIYRIAHAAEGGGAAGAGGQLLQAVRLEEVPAGVVVTRGMCDERPVGDPTTPTALTAPDVAYRITKQAVLTFPTAQLFPGGFLIMTCK